MSTLPYRKNVAAFILNEEGKILCCKRADKFKDWQLPQGGIDEGETPEQAVKRELKEEVGLLRGALLAQLKDPIRYEWPTELHTRGFGGQEQYFFVFRAPLGWKPDFETFTVAEPNQRPSNDSGQNSSCEKEFEEASWDDKSVFLAKVEPTFRGASYKKAVLALSKKYPDLFSDK